MSGATIDILLVDDEEAHAEAIRRNLEKSALKFAIRSVGTLGEFRAAVAQRPPRIALIDLNLPDGRAVELLSTPLQDAPFPILIMTSHGNETTAVEALKAGALDYVVKSPEAFAGMARSIERALREWDLLLERKLAQEALWAAKEAAEAASRSKSEFLALMSHELRTPLNGVLGGAQMLRCTGLSAEQEQCLDLIMTSAQNQLSLVNDVLDLARLESGGLGVDAGDFLLRQLVTDTVKLQQHALREKGLTLSVEVGGEVPDQLVGDALRFRQILLKMLSNAVKFTERGGVTVTVRVVSRQEEDLVLRCCVADTGIGVAREHMDLIFAPFVQADMSATRKYGGSGLGLTICRRLTEALGGRIWFESNQGEGSVFCFELPLRCRQVPAAAGSGAGERAGAQGTPRRLRVLLADDDAACIKVFSGILGKLGHQVTAAVNGGEALEFWRDRGPFDIILMDIQMPVMSGLEALRAIRELERGRGGHVPVIAQTAHASKYDQELLLAEGFDGYQAKPLMITELLSQMARLTGGGAPEAGAFC